MKGVINHIELYVKELNTSKAFWGWLLDELGYEVFQSWQEGVSYRLGDTYIVLVQIEERFKDVPYHRCRAGLNHLAFDGETKEFVDALTTKLRIKGVPILYEDKHPYAAGEDYYAVFFEDPDRMKVEVIANSLQ